MKILMGAFSKVIGLFRHNPIHLWDNDCSFNEIMREVNGYTLVDKKRCFMLYQLASQANNLSGEFAEVGVYKGGTALLLSQVSQQKNKHLHLFDTFSGMPPSDAIRDKHNEGDFGDNSLESTKAYLSSCQNVHFYQGLFPATA